LESPKASNVFPQITNQKFWDPTPFTSHAASRKACLEFSNKHNSSGQKARHDSTLDISFPLGDGMASRGQKTNRQDIKVHHVHPTHNGQTSLPAKKAIRTSKSVLGERIIRIPKRIAGGTKCGKPRDGSGIIEIEHRLCGAFSKALHSPV